MATLDALIEGERRGILNEREKSILSTARERGMATPAAEEGGGFGKFLKDVTVGPFLLQSSREAIKEAQENPEMVKQVLPIPFAEKIIEFATGKQLEFKKPKDVRVERTERSGRVVRELPISAAGVSATT